MSDPLEGSSVIHGIVSLIFCFLFLLYKMHFPAITHLTPVNGLQWTFSDSVVFVHLTFVIQMSFSSLLYAKYTNIGIPRIIMNSQYVFRDYRLSFITFQEFTACFIYDPYTVMWTHFKECNSFNKWDFLYDNDKGRGGRDRMVVSCWINNYLSNQFLLLLKLWVGILLMARCTRENIMWYSSSVTCNRLVVFSRYSGYLHQ
jgi:hypothetical protein